MDDNINYYTSMMAMFVYFTDTAFSPPAPCNFHVTTNCASSPEYYYYFDLNLSGKVTLDLYSDFILFLTQSFSVNVDLNVGPSSDMPAMKTAVKVVFVNSNTASLVRFQGYNLPYKLCADSIISDSSKFMPLYLKVLFYETPDFNIRDSVYALRQMWIHDTAFMYNNAVDYDVLVLAKVMGRLSHHVSLDNVSWCDNRYRFLHHSLLLAQNTANPFLKTSGRLQLNLNIFLAHNYVGHTDTFIQISACLMCFSYIQQISMTGTNYFAENGGGTVIKLIYSQLKVSGNLTITDGHAFQGGGIYMDEWSHLTFVEPLVAGFYNNIADHGSAIYSALVNVPIYSPIDIGPSKVYSPGNVTSINI